MKLMSRVKDLTGKKFGRLEVIGIDDRETRKTYWICQCDCGNIKSVRSDLLQSGATRSCGCLHNEQAAINVKKNHTHKMSNTRIYSIWNSMKRRCYNHNDSHWERYGGRGIAVCEEWRKDLMAFYEWAMKNGYADNLTIDRIDNDGDYEPSNCRWVDNKAQSRNGSTNINIKIGNSTRTLAEWCEIFGISYQAARNRYIRTGACGLEDLFNAGYRK